MSARARMVFPRPRLHSGRASARCQRQCPDRQACGSGAAAPCRALYDRSFRPVGARPVAAVRR
eukprot:4802588-Pyramimonas_sp.AAC.1